MSKGSSASYITNDGPYQNGRGVGGTPLDIINPDEIADDGDDGFLHTPVVRNGGAGGHNGSVDNRSSFRVFTKGQKANKAAAELSYDPVPGGKDYFPEATKSNKRKGYVVLGVLAFIVVGAIVGGIVGGIVGNGNVGEKDGKHTRRSLPLTHSCMGNNMDEEGKEEDLGRESPEIKGLLNNGRLHKVFPAMDYTPSSMSDPRQCSSPQNDVTRDLAVLSQLTNSVYLHSTDCHLPEMVLHAIDRLGADLKVWLGVAVNSNTGDNERQLQQLYTAMDSVKDKSVFKGVIVGSSDDESVVGYVKRVKAAFARNRINLPVAAPAAAASQRSGGGGAGGVAQVSDLTVVSHIDAFHAGVPIDLAADWTMDLWHHATMPTTTKKKHHLLTEVGWTSDAGNVASCNNNQCPTYAAVTGIDAMNRFMDEWVCRALENGVDYIWCVQFTPLFFFFFFFFFCGRYWWGLMLFFFFVVHRFEAFDTPWTSGNWGVINRDRNLKPGLKIPDCGGKSSTAF